MHDDAVLAGGPGNRGRSGVGFDRSRVSEAGSVIADLGEHPGAGESTEACEAGDDLGVRVLIKSLFRRGGQVLGVAAGGIESPQ
jgi:hypothetical protein